MKYIGLLLNGTEFTSRDRFVFHLGLGQVIKGWDLGLMNMCVGERRILVVPPHLAYGGRPSHPKVPVNATLKFDIELLKIDRKEEL
ncbi:peptidyl-prolyl cis-trans isomerase, FKBP-type, partial [Ostertagia ostertagi]